MPEASRPAPLGAIVIEERYCGPRGSANGGYASGALAAFLDGPAEATLKAPPPLGRPLEIVASDGAVAAFDGETLIATARPAAVAVDLPAIPDAAAVDEARQAYLADPQSAIFPYCFVCGPRRPEGEGMRIFAGAIAESPVNAGWWTPGADLADGDGLVRGEFLWAALDCPSAFALRRTGGWCCSAASRPKSVAGRSRASACSPWPGRLARKAASSSPIPRCSTRMARSSRAPTLFGSK
jgi:hypothetical protein